MLVFRWLIGVKHPAWSCRRKGSALHVKCHSVYTVGGQGGASLELLSRWVACLYCCLKPRWLCLSHACSSSLVSGGEKTHLFAGLLAVSVGKIAPEGKKVASLRGSTANLEVSICLTVYMRKRRGGNSSCRDWHERMPFWEQSSSKEWVSAWEVDQGTPHLLDVKWNTSINSIGFKKNALEQCTRTIMQF